MCLLIFRATKAAERRGHVLFADGSKGFAKGRNQNARCDENVELILAGYRTGVDRVGEGGAEVRLVPREETGACGCDLDIGRYIPGAAADVVDVATALAEPRAAQAALRAAEARLDERLAGAGYG